jgi:hypothetical protein
MSAQITINAIYLFEFASKQEWINKAQSWFQNLELSAAEKTVCFDVHGNVLNVGADFSRADELETYPVKVYRLIRTTEAYADGLTF